MRMKLGLSLRCLGWSFGSQAAVSAILWVYCTEVKRIAGSQRRVGHVAIRKRQNSLSASAKLGYSWSEPLALL